MKIENKTLKMLKLIECNLKEMQKMVQPKDCCETLENLIEFLSTNKLEKLKINKVFSPGECYAKTMTNTISEISALLCDDTILTLQVQLLSLLNYIISKWFSIFNSINSWKLFCVISRIIEINFENEKILTQIITLSCSLSVNFYNIEWLRPVVYSLRECVLDNPVKGNILIKCISFFKIIMTQYPKIAIEWKLVSFFLEINELIFCYNHLKSIIVSNTMILLKFVAIVQDEDKFDHGDEMSNFILNSCLEPLFRKDNTKNGQLCHVPAIVLCYSWIGVVHLLKYSRFKFIQVFLYLHDESYYSIYPFQRFLVHIFNIDQTVLDISSFMGFEKIFKRTLFNLTGYFDQNKECVISEGCEFLFNKNMNYTYSDVGATGSSLNFLKKDYNLNKWCILSEKILLLNFFVECQLFEGLMKYICTCCNETLYSTAALIFDLYNLVAQNLVHVNLNKFYLEPLLNLYHQVRTGKLVFKIPHSNYTINRNSIQVLELLMSCHDGKNEPPVYSIDLLSIFIQPYENILIDFSIYIFVSDESVLQNLLIKSNFKKNIIYWDWIAISTILKICLNKKTFVNHKLKTEPHFIDSDRTNMVNFEYRQFIHSLINCYDAQLIHILFEDDVFDNYTTCNKNSRYNKFCTVSKSKNIATKDNNPHKCKLDHEPNVNDKIDQMDAKLNTCDMLISSSLVFFLVDNLLLNEHADSFLRAYIFRVVNAFLDVLSKQNFSPRLYKIYKSYFLFIGRLSSSKNGSEILFESKFFSKIFYIMKKKSFYTLDLHFVKLYITHICHWNFYIYNNEYSKQILNNFIKESSMCVSVYMIKFFHFTLRIFHDVKKFNKNIYIDILVNFLISSKCLDVNYLVLKLILDLISFSTIYKKIISKKLDDLKYFQLQHGLYFKKISGFDGTKDDFNVNFQYKEKWFEKFQKCKNRNEIDTFKTKNYKSFSFNQNGLNTLNYLNIRDIDTMSTSLSQSLCNLNASSDCLVDRPKPIIPQHFNVIILHMLMDMENFNKVLYQLEKNDENFTLFIQSKRKTSKNFEKIFTNLENWVNFYNDQYIDFVENAISKNSYYSMMYAFNLKDFSVEVLNGLFHVNSKIGIFVILPMHIYRIFASTKIGLKILKIFGKLDEMIFSVKNFNSKPHNFPFLRKSLWVFANMSLTKYGQIYLIQNGFLFYLFEIYQSSFISLLPVVYYSISCWSNSIIGRQELKKFNWVSTVVDAKIKLVHNHKFDNFLQWNGHCKQSEKRYSFTRNLKHFFFKKNFKFNYNTCTNYFKRSAATGARYCNDRNLIFNSNQLLSNYSSLKYHKRVDDHIFLNIFNSSFGFTKNLFYQDVQYFRNADTSFVRSNK
ncbi:hypothetical protein A3Q56_00063 [Intoshia linei]|uniref:Rapamycin-insensitive companion of mTOR middle domain-containing protein n=1 Tax=Intoshia linei TaxID=1819745 RepID=A0A177BER2_9BILA|nr:hypothetical protein A3Q56_00063 [Intoshia linei]